VKRAWVLAVALALAVGSVGAAPTEGFRFERKLDVPVEAWVRVPLDARALARALPAHDWRIVGPEGESVAFRVLAMPRELVHARTLSLEEQSSGWSIVFDLGPTPLLHRRLEVNLLRRTSAPDCTLEGSEDLESWTLLGEGTLFRLGAGETLHRSGLEYPESDARYLRLQWPRAAGFPEFSDVGVQPLEQPAGGPVAAPIEIRPRSTSAAGAEYRLELPGPGLSIRQLVLHWRRVPRAAVGYRLLRGVSQRWEVVASGTFRPDQPATIELQEQRLDRSSLRLDLGSLEGEPLKLDRARVEVNPVWILFRAERAGRYSLLYGGTGAQRPPAEADASVGPVLDVRPGGEESELPLPPIPSRVTQPVEASESTVNEARWPVIVDGIGPGEVVKLELPDVVREEVADLNRIRILAGKREVPFLVWTPEEPELRLEFEELTAATMAEGRRRRLRVEHPALSTLLSQIEISARGGRPEPSLLARFPVATRPGVDSRPVELHSTWDCRHSPELQCRAELGQVPAAANRELELFVEPRRGALPTTYSLRGWGPRPGLYFVMPDTDELMLTWTRSRRFRRHDYPLREHADVLLALPSKEAGLRLEAVTEARQRRDALGRAALIAMLVVTAIALLWVLARNTRKP
jgi:hypothetical protein